MTPSEDIGRCLRRPRFWQGLAWSLLLLVAVLTLMPRPPQVNLPLLSWDKAQHFLAYALLAWVFLQAWEGKRVLAWLAFLIAVGIALEGLQGLFGVRRLEYFDMFANSLGVLLGYLLWCTPLGLGFSRLEALLHPG